MHGTDKLTQAFVLVMSVGMFCIYFFAPKVLWIIGEGPKPGIERPETTTTEDNQLLAKKILEKCEARKWLCITSENGKSGELMSLFFQLQHPSYMGGQQHRNADDWLSWAKLNKKANHIMTTSFVALKHEADESSSTFCIFLHSYDDRYEVILIKPSNQITKASVQRQTVADNLQALKKILQLTLKHLG